MLTLYESRLATLQGRCASRPAATVMLKMGETKEGKSLRELAEDDEDADDEDDVRDNEEVGERGSAVAPAVSPEHKGQSRRRRKQEVRAGNPVRIY